MEHNQPSSSSSEDDERPPRPPKQARKEWLQHGQVSRSTLRRWNERASESSGSSDSSDSSSTESSNDTRNESISSSSSSESGSDITDQESNDGDRDAFYDNIGDDAEGDGGDVEDGGHGGDGDNGNEIDGDNINRLIEDAEHFEFMPEALFQRSPHSAGQAVLQLLQLYARHAMTKSCLKDLIKLVHGLLPVGNTFPSTFHFLQNSIAPFIPPKSSVAHVACKCCGYYLGKSERPVVPCPVCGNQVTVKFQEFSLPVLVKYLFERRGLADAVDANNGEAGSDICNSEEYRRLKGQYQGQYDLTLLWNADGLKVRKSGPASLWELSVCICEVPPQVRNKFTLVIGLWYAQHSPNLKAFLTPFMASLQELERNGVRWTHPTSGQAHVSKVIAPASSVDAPVRADLQNILHHGGEFSCHTCEIEGMELVVGPRTSKRVYNIPDEFPPLRSKETMRLQAERAEAENLIVKGVKGSSLLETIPTCDPEKSIILDYLHLVLLGVVRQFFKLWFTGSGTDWYIWNGKRLVTPFLKAIKRTYEVCRCPTDAGQWKLFKGSTWRTWLLFVSLPALAGRLKEKYYQHWMLLVIGMSLLLQETVSGVDLALAENLLSLFVRDTQELYGYSAMSYNLHCLSHLALITRRWGAPWSVSAFKFENLNGTLGRLVHGTIRITEELSNTLNIITATNTLDYLMNAEGLQIGLRVSLLSPVSGIDLTNAERHALLQRLVDINDVRFFRRAKIAGMIFTSAIYAAERATDNKHVCYKEGGQEHYGIVQFYAKKGAGLFAVLKKLLVEPDRQFKHTETDLIVEHIIPIQTTDVYTVILIENVVCKVFRVHQYVCKELNRYEHAL